VVIDIMNTPEQYVLFGLISIIVIIIVIAYMWSKVQRRRVQDAMEDIDSRPDNRRKRSREMLDRLIETKQQIAQNQTIVQTLIEARDEARCRLTSMERKYQTMYENAGIGIARLDATYRYIEVNQYYAQIYGYESPETFMDMNPFFAYVCPFFHHNHEHMLLHESKTMIKNDCHHVARDDVSIVVRNTFVPVLSENGDVEFYDLFSENVTEETRTRQELEQSNRALDSVLSAFGALIRYTRRDDALKRSIEELVGRFDILSGVVALIEPDGSLQYVYSCGIQYDMEQAILQATSMIGNMGPMFQTVISGRQYLLFIIQEERRVVGVLGFIMSDLWIPFSTDRTDDQELLSYYAESLASFLAHRT